MDRSERAKVIMTMLQEEGFSPSIDQDGDVKFKYESGNYFIQVPETDETYFMLAYPQFWSIENEGERKRVHAAALAVTQKVKAAKVYPVRDDTWATIEMFCSSPEVVRPVLRRCLGAIQSAVMEFRRQMHEDT